MESVLGHRIGKIIIIFLYSPVRHAPIVLFE